MSLRGLGLTWRVDDDVLDAATCARLRSAAPDAAPGELSRAPLPDDDPAHAAVLDGIDVPHATVWLVSAGAGAHRGLGASAGAVVLLHDADHGGLRDPRQPAQVLPRAGRRVWGDRLPALAPTLQGPVVMIEVVPRPASGALVVLADAGTPSQTVDSLTRAASARGVPVQVVDPDTLDPLTGPLPPGAMLYAAATSRDAHEAELQLWQRGVGTLHAHDDGPEVTVFGGLTRYARVGLPVPRHVRVRRHDKHRLPELVDWLGGYPVVVKVPGGEIGIGTMRADSDAALVSLLDLLWARRESPQLLAFVDDAMHWRIVVVDGQVVTAYRNPVRAGDFRSEPTDQRADYGLTPPDEAARIAIEATQVSGVLLGGVDVLEHRSGRFFLLEVNFPCYFPQGERFGAADVAGAMLDALMRRASAAS